jgi:hypothetical protein
VDGGLTEIEGELIIPVESDKLEHPASVIIPIKAMTKISQNIFLNILSSKQNG